MLRWTLQLKGTPKKYYHAAVAASGQKLCSFSGSSKKKDQEVHVNVFNTVSLHWRKLTPVAPGYHEVPSNRSDHTAVLIKDTVYIWGGYWRDEYCNVLYAFDVDTHGWFKPQVSGTVPEERWSHSACVLETVMFIYGGFTKRPGCTNDIYKLDTSTMVWSFINTRGTPPPGSYGHSSTIIGTKMFVFGGEGDQFTHYHHIRVFDTETDCWLNTPSAQLLPEGRYFHSAFTYNGELYIFGGIDQNQTSFNDLWKFSPETFSWKKVEPKGKGPRREFWMYGCMVGARVVLFGGYKGFRYTDELFVLDLSPSLKTLCKLVVLQYGLEQSELPHNIRWELAAMTTNRRQWRRRRPRPRRTIPR